MHLSDGILPLWLPIAAAAPAVAGVAAGLVRIRDEDLPRVAALSASLFVASLMHVPMGPASVHLSLNGLAGLLLGGSVLPALAVALALQALFLGHGGITVLGINLLILGLPALFCRGAFGRLATRSAGRRSLMIAGFLTGACGVLLGAVLAASALEFAGREFQTVARVLLAAHLPVAVVEGVFTGFVLLFLRRVRPDLLPGPFHGRADADGPGAGA